MKNNQKISIKSSNHLLIKKKLNLATTIIIAILGVSSLFIKFFLIDGVLAFRAFTVDGNLFTTIVSIVAAIKYYKNLSSEDEDENHKLFFFQLASAVTEAVIFIVVMIGYLPMFTDDPKITPYHMFCLHVAIPILAVARFVFFEKPIGILKPFRILSGAIPIGVYGLGVVTAIKLGILPISLVPYSFLDFNANFLWYFIFALVAIPSFGYMWSWLFYRLNLRASLLWYSSEDVERLQKARIKARSHFDEVNSMILLVFCAMAIVVLMFSLRGTSVTSTKIQYEMLKYVSYYILDDYSNIISSDDWKIEDGMLYRGDIPVGDGTEQNANPEIFSGDVFTYETSVYVMASDLSPSVAAKYDGLDYVCVKCSADNKDTAIGKCGGVLDTEIVTNILSDEQHWYCREEQINKVKYYHFCTSFGASMDDSGVGIMSIYIPLSDLMPQVKQAEHGNDIMMIAIICVVFAFLYIITIKWIRVLENSVQYLKAIASGRTPEEYIDFGNSSWMSGLERELNVLRDINDD